MPDRVSEGKTPTLVVVSGPPGSGKTTLAHGIAQVFPCPAICRDEIKEGMAHAEGQDFQGGHQAFGSFEHISIPAPSIDVDTTDGYDPTLDEIVAFINRAWHARVTFPNTGAVH